MIGVAPATVLLSFIHAEIGALVWLIALIIAAVGIVKPLPAIGLKSSKSAVLAIVAMVGIIPAVGTFASISLEKDQENLAANGADMAVIQTGARDIEKTKARAEAYQKRLEENREKRHLADLAAAKEAEDKQNGFRCLSRWSGTHDGFKAAVKERMRNPKSFEHISTKITKNTGGEHLIFMEYRAENGFGGMSVEQATGIVKNADCSFTILALQ